MRAPKGWTPPPDATLGPAVNLATPKARGRTHVPGMMNKIEEAYSEVLETRRIAGEIAAWWFEAVKLRLADKTFYTCDFLVQLSDGFLEMHEVKAVWSTGKAGFQEDARVKIKVAAKLFPLFVFVAVAGAKKRGDWTWTEERF